MTTMTTAEQLARMDEWLACSQAPSMPSDPATYEDEDTLRRAFGGLSAAALREQRSGPYFPTLDADGFDRGGWAWGAR